MLSGYKSTKGAESGGSNQQTEPLASRLYRGLDQIDAILITVILITGGWPAEKRQLSWSMLRLANLSA